VFLALGAGSLGLTHGARWPALRWPVAIAADATVLSLVLGPPDRAHPSAQGAIALAALLVVVYLAGFAARILQTRRAVNVFEAAQSATVLLVGLGGAVRMAYASSASAHTLAIPALAIGATCYAVAFVLVARQEEHVRNFLYFTTLGLALVVTGGTLLLSSEALPFALVALGLVTAAIGAWAARATLLAHGAVYLGGAALISPLSSHVWSAFTNASPTPLGASGAVPLVALVLSAASAVVSRRRTATAPLAFSSFAIALLAVLGMCAPLVAALGSPLAGGDPGALAALRTCVLALGAVLSAGLGRAVRGVRELPWLALPLLALAALELLFEGIPKGRPLTLAIAFTAFGVALVLATWMGRSRTPERR
jgi:hypothetical protein